eukprot:15041684-Alexandrium_andersonii.AAC.1
MPAPSQAAPRHPEPWVIPQDPVVPGPLEPGPVQASIAQGVATAPWRQAAGRVANAVTRAFGQAASWAHGNEPAVEGPEPDPATRRAQEA